MSDTFAMHATLRCPAMHRGAPHRRRAQHTLRHDSQGPQSGAWLDIDVWHDSPTCHTSAVPHARHCTTQRGMTVATHVTHATRHDGDAAGRFAPERNPPPTPHPSTHLLQHIHPYPPHTLPTPTTPRPSVPCLTTLSGTTTKKVFRSRVRMDVGRCGCGSCDRCPRAAVIEACINCNRIWCIRTVRTQL
jgi:hypothetical protein